MKVHNTITLNIYYKKKYLSNPATEKKNLLHHHLNIPKLIS